MWDEQFPFLATRCNNNYTELNDVIFSFGLFASLSVVSLLCEASLGWWKAAVAAAVSRHVLTLSYFLERDRETISVRLYLSAMLFVGFLGKFCHIYA